MGTTGGSAGAWRGNIVAVVGPCIGQQAFEVGPEFEAAFAAVNQSYARYFSKPAPDARAHFDLPGFVGDRLRVAGAGRVEDMAQCTYANSNRFFSFRRTTHARETDYGRQISAIMLE